MSNLYNFAEQAAIVFLLAANIGKYYRPVRAHRREFLSFNAGRFYGDSVELALDGISGRALMRRALDGISGCAGVVLVASDLMMLFAVLV